MANSLWDRLNGKNKNKKSSYEISKKTNIPEEKVKEIMNGERIVPHDRVDALVGAIQEDNTAEKALNLLQIKKWVNETDLKKKRMDMGYETQKDLARELNINSSVICRLEQKNLKHISDSFLTKYYDFINDDLNINIKKKGKQKKVKSVLYADKDAFKKIDPVEAEKWYDNFDFKSYMRENQITYSKFAEILGYSSGSTSLISNLAGHRVDVHTSGKTVILRAYAYINGFVEAKNKAVDEQTNKDDKVIEEDKNIQIEEENKPVMHTPKQFCFDATHNITFSSEKPQKIEQLSFEDIKPATSIATLNANDLISNGLEYNTNVKAEEEVKIAVSEFDYMENTIKEQQDEINKLKLQISRYEKLIDMIER